MRVGSIAFVVWSCFVVNVASAQSSSDAGPAKRWKTSVDLDAGTLGVVGGVGTDQVAKVLSRHLKEAKACYDKELKKNESLPAGTVRLSFVVGPLGDLVEANVRETELHDDSVQECVLSQLRKWKFPSPKGGGVVTANAALVFAKSEEK